MGCNTKVLNISTNWTYKRSVAIGLVDQCEFDWVEHLRTVRTLSDEEKRVKRAIQARMRDPLAFAELPQLVYQPAEQNQAQTREGYQLVRAANQFAEMGALSG